MSSGGEGVGVGGGGGQAAAQQAATQASVQAAGSSSASSAPEVQSSFSSGTKYTYRCTVAPTSSIKVMGVGMGTPGYEITLVGEDDRAVTIFARAMSDLKPGEMTARADGIELVEAGSSAGDLHGRYVPVQLKDVEGKMHILLVRMDRARGALETYSHGKNIPYGDNFPPLAVVHFLSSNTPDDSVVKEAMKSSTEASVEKGKKKQVRFAPFEAGSSSSSSSSSSSASGAQTEVGRAIKTLHDDAVYFTSQALKITPADSEKIKGVVGRFHNITDEQWVQYKQRINVKPGFKDDPYAEGSPDVIHVRAGEPFLALNGEMCISPYSLLIARGKDGEINVEILLKGKVPGFSDPSRPHGSFKSIKTTFDMTTGRIRVQCTIDIGAMARQKANFRWANGKPLTKEEIGQDQAKLNVVRQWEEKLVKECLDELQLVKDHTGLEISKQTTYLAKKQKDPDKVAVRVAEGKAIRQEYDLILTYTVTKAEGDLQNPECVAAVRTGMTVTTIPQALYECLENTAKTTANLHEQGLAHRDIKPANLLLMESNDGMRVEMNDFGLAVKIDKITGRPLTNQPVSGTFSIRPPELVVPGFVELIPQLDLSLNQVKIDKRKEETDFRKVDVYGLGCTFYMILTAKAEGDPVRSSVPYALAGTELYSRAIRYRNDGATWSSTERNNELHHMRVLYSELKQVENSRWNDARLYLVRAKVPPALIDLIMDMLQPDPKQRCDMAKVAAGIEQLKSIIKK